MRTVYLIMALLVGALVVPAGHAATARQQAVELASKKVSIAAIGNAVYQAVKAEPDKAGEICEEVLGQRTNWTAEECSVIIRAVLMARPDLKRSFTTWVTSGGAAVSAGSADAAVADTHQALTDLLKSLHRVSLEEGVLESALGMATGVTGGVAGAVNGTPGSVAGEEGVPHILEVIVTPPDMSTNQ